jgi:5'-nucleotidase
MHFSSFARKPIALVDADNVLYHWEKRFIADVLVLDPAYPVIEFGKRTGMEMLDKSGHEPEITVRVKTRPGFYLDLDPIEGAQVALEEMKSAGIEVFICTAPSLSNPTCASDKHAAIKRDFGRFWADRTIITKDKTMVKGDILIDDKPEVHGLLIPEWDHVVFDQSYNRHITDKARLTEWVQWEESLVPVLTRRLQDAVS